MFKLSGFHKHLVGTTLLALAAAGATAGPIVNLNGVQYVQYGDGQSYSLPNAINTQCGGTSSGCQYNVKSTPGDIKDLVVLATGTSNGPAVSNFAGMDNAYATPNGAGGAPFFSTNPVTSQSSQGTINNNGANTWDSSLSALKGFLAGDQMVFFFNNNQTNTQGGATQSLAAWAQLSITDAAGNVIGIYDFTNNGGKYGLFTEGGGGHYLGDVGNYTSTGAGPLAGTNAATDYVLSGGAICYLAGVPTSCSNPHDLGPVNHNLGANQAAYAILFPELNAQLTGLFSSLSSNALDNYTLHVDLRLGCDANTAAGNCTGNGTSVPWGRDLDNGYEQVFMGTSSALGCQVGDPSCNPVPVPEPSSLALFAAALLGVFGAHAWRRSRHT